MNGLIPKLRELGRRVNELTDNRVNYGGCCVYAAAVAERLQELGLKHVECIASVDDWFDHVGAVEDARNNLIADEVYAEGENGPLDWGYAGLSLHHIAVRFKHNGRWYTHDSDTVIHGRDTFGKNGYGATPDGLTPLEARAMADDPDGWNSTFDRRDIPAIRRLVQEVLQ